MCINENFVANLLSGVLYTVTTYTVDVRGAGTDSNVYLVLYGSDDTSSGRLMLRSDSIDAFK